MDVLSNNKRLAQVAYEYEVDFEADIVANYETLLGKRTIYIDTKKKLGTRALGGTVPDGFFIDQTDADNPAFYLVVSA